MQQDVKLAWAETALPKAASATVKVVKSIFADELVL